MYSFPTLSRIPGASVSPGARATVLIPASASRAPPSVAESSQRLHPEPRLVASSSDRSSVD
jgi:hypothetical protein